MSDIVLVGRRKRSFTSRMQEVIDLAGKGLKNGEIAEQLGVSKSAIDVMKTKINRRLKITGVYENVKR